ncbi:4822_t:CDS:2 [Entrophospora sp. SA101]|nr:4822_t:CDS:2 [Entrophospora sp. SA101]
MSSSPASNSNKILKKNSPYFTSAFSSEWVKKDEKNDGLIIFEKPNISAEDFELIVKFLYNKPINFDEVEITNIFELLVPADELFLTNFIKEIETYLINNHRRWSKKGFGIHYLSMTVRLKICEELQTFAINLFAQNPQILFDSNKHLYMEDDVLFDKSFWRPANNSFIFSMDTDPNKWDSARLSRINPDFSEKAFLISNYSGPQFGNGDLKLGDHFNFKTSSCKKSYYLESIRNTDDNFFSIEEYELFQLVKGV